MIIRDMYDELLDSAFPNPESKAVLDYLKWGEILW